jgi:curved DNA-binding protein
VAIPTLAGAVKLKVPAGTRGGQQLRLAGRGLPTPQGGSGDLYAIVQLVLPPELTERERSLLQDLAAASAFDPRRHLE